MTDSGLTSAMNYECLVEEALRTVVRNALEIVQKHGLPGDCHFYITFRTQADGVQIDDSLKKNNPQEMTIILQHQFWDLKVEDDHFSVGLSFSGVQHLLIIPFSALTHFTDPSVGFGLQFSEQDDDSQPAKTEIKKVELVDVSTNQQNKDSKDSKVLNSPTSTDTVKKQAKKAEPKATKANVKAQSVSKSAKSTDSAQIVSLDRFRKNSAPKS